MVFNIGMLRIFRRRLIIFCNTSLIVYTSMWWITHNIMCKMFDQKQKKNKINM